MVARMMFRDNELYHAYGMGCTLVSPCRVGSGIRNDEKLQDTYCYMHYLVQLNPFLCSIWCASYVSTKIYQGNGSMSSE